MACAGATKKPAQNGQEIWRRTHAAGASFQWPERVPYLAKSFVCYHTPEPLLLDVLVRMLLHRIDVGVVD